jgi:hypothetical protein
LRRARASEAAADMTKRLVPPHTPCKRAELHRLSRPSGLEIGKRCGNVCHGIRRQEGNGGPSATPAPRKSVRSGLLGKEQLAASATDNDRRALAGVRRPVTRAPGRGPR